MFTWNVLSLLTTVSTIFKKCISTHNIIFDQIEFLTSLQSKEKYFLNLFTILLLSRDQKLIIVDQYPKLVFPLQTTSVVLLTPAFFKDIDMVTRQCVRKFAVLSP